MGHSQEDKARSRERILDAAAGKIRAEGLNGFSISEVMKDAGLTHGSFYAHFSSRDDLIAAALQHALFESDVVYAENKPRDIIKVINAYLSRKHRDEPWAGCAVSALASEITRAGSETQDVMHEHVAKYLDNINNILEETDNEDQAIPVISMLVGALTLSRLTKDRRLSDRILKDTRDHLQATLTQSK